MGKRKAAEEMDKERERRVDETEHISEEEAKRRMIIANKMIDVQKELLATHAPTKVRVDEGVRRCGGILCVDQLPVIQSLSSSILSPSTLTSSHSIIILSPSTLTPSYSHPPPSHLHTPTLTPSHLPYSHPHTLTPSILLPSTLTPSILSLSTLTQPIMGVHSQKVLEEAKYYMQEQLLRKAAQKEALAAMDQEQQR